MNKSPASTSLIYSNLASDPDLSDLVEEYVAANQGRIVDLIEAYQHQDWAQLGVLAHQIKGSAGSYGFHTLTDPAHNLETACEFADTLRLTQTFDHLIELLHRLTSDAPFEE